MDFSSNTLSGNSNMAISGSAPTQRPKEVSYGMEMIDKLLHELHEEAIGLNGTLNGVLAPQAPQAESASEKTVHLTGLGEALDGYAKRIQLTTSVLRSIRSRCEL